MSELDKLEATLASLQAELDTTISTLRFAALIAY
jgi:hypothetical protein